MPANKEDIKLLYFKMQMKNVRGMKKEPEVRSSSYFIDLSKCFMHNNLSAFHTVYVVNFRS